jgi:hypothetical protein
MTGALPFLMTPLPMFALSVRQTTAQENTMSAEDYIPKPDAELPPYLNNFVTYANANLVALGLVAADVTPISTGATSYQTALNAVETAKEALKQAVIAKDTAKKTVTTNLRTTARKLQANPVVTPAQKAALGLTPRTGQRSHVEPSMPDSVLAEGNANGTNLIRWGRSKNPLGTIFVVEVQNPKTGDWHQVGAVSTLRFKHTGQTPGVFQVYRVIATRAGRQSEPSQAASVYGASEPVALRLAA